jgi:Superinfection immunity protein
VKYPPVTPATALGDVIYGRLPVGSLLGVFDEQDELIYALGFLVFLLGAYFIPTAVAFGRDARSRWLVAVINTFLGWTLVGWIVALAVAIRSARRAKEPTPIS